MDIHRQKLCSLSLACKWSSAGAKERAIGQSRSSATTKVHISCDVDGYPLNFKITEGDVHDNQVAGELIEVGGQADYFITDKGYDTEFIRDKARSHNMIPFTFLKGRMSGRLTQGLVAICTNCIVLLKIYLKDLSIFIASLLAMRGWLVILSRCSIWHGPSFLVR